jgi:hypothetical protein
VRTIGTLADSASKIIRPAFKIKGAASEIVAVRR